MATQVMMELKRNMQICSGVRSCGLCTETFPDLEDGKVRIARWAYEHNFGLINRVINDCPVEALEIYDA